MELMTSTQKKMLRYGTVEVENRLKTGDPSHRSDDPSQV